MSPGRHAEPEYTPDDPRYPDVTVTLGLANVGNMIACTVDAMRSSRLVPTKMLDEFRLDVMSARSGDEAMHRIMCWVDVQIATVEVDR